MRKEAQTEEKKAVSRHGILWTKRGSQLVFATETDEPTFQPRLHYVVGARDYFQESRRARSLNVLQAAVGDSRPLAEAQDGDVDILKDVVIEIEEETKKVGPGEEEKRPARDTGEKAAKGNKWSLLRTVLRAVALFRRNEAESIKDSVRGFIMD